MKYAFYVDKWVRITYNNINQTKRGDKNEENIKNLYWWH